MARRPSCVCLSEKCKTCAARERKRKSRSIRVMKDKLDKIERVRARLNLHYNRPFNHVPTPYDRIFG